MNVVIAFFTAVLFIAISKGESFDVSDFPNHAKLDQVGDFDLHWKYDDEMITFLYEGRSKGWIGLGFSSNGGMMGADIIVTAVDQSGRKYVSDRHGADQNGYPPRDDHQDYELLQFNKNDTFISAAFRRKRNTCDPFDWALVDDDTVRVIYSKSDTVPKSEDTFEKHTETGVKSIMFFNMQEETQDGKPPEEGSVPVDFFVTNQKVPDDQDTLYWCEIHTLKKSDKKTQIIKVEPVLQQDNIDVVHHVLLYVCTANVSDYLYEDKGGAPCFDNVPGFQDAFNQCQTQVLAAWAKGGESITYPPDKAMQMPNANEDKYILIEMHYDNSQFKKGKVDSSGLRLWTTEKLRETETIITEFGVDVTPVAMVLPPQTDEFTVYGYCNAQCINNLPEGGVGIMGGILHSHLTGRKMRLRHFRNGVELPPILSDEHYDFDYQNYKLVNTDQKIMPGDDVVLECVYNTRDRVNTTFGGLSTHEEMCIAFVEIYPAPYSGFFCVSAPDVQQLYATLGINVTSNYTVIEDDGTEVMVGEYLKSYDYKWTPEKVKQFEKDSRDCHHYSICAIGYDNQTNVQVYDQFGYPNVTEPYVEPDLCDVV